MSTINISIGHDNNAMVTQLLNIEVISANTATQGRY